MTIKIQSLIFDTSRATGKLRRNRLKRGILSDLIIAYLLEEQNTLCTPPAGGKDQSSGNSSSANSASVSSFSFSITPSDNSRRAVSSGIRCLETDLLPNLNGNSVLIMDNGIRYIYLPPYSPDLNPIEKLWSKVKALLRKFKSRTLDALPNAIQNAFQSVSPSDCSGWFKFCDY